MEDQVVDRQHSHNSGLLKYSSEMGDESYTLENRPCPCGCCSEALCFHKETGSNMCLLNEKLYKSYCLRNVIMQEPRDENKEDKKRRKRKKNRDAESLGEAAQFSF